MYWVVVDSASPIMTSSALATPKKAKQSSINESSLLLFIMIEFRLILWIMSIQYSSVNSSIYTDIRGIHGFFGNAKIVFF